MAGPLAGIRIVEMAGIGPGPFCGMVLADLGADIVRVDRPGAPAPTRDIVARGRRTVGLDLKTEQGRSDCMDLIARADGLIEGFRPGVMERLGLGPEDCATRNPRLVYGRMTGWGQDGPWSKMAGHDINYIALTGALWSMGRKGERPPPPLNLVGDYGGGGMLLAVGMLAALLEAKSSGKGQVVDAAMTDGAATLMSMFYGMKSLGRWKNEREANRLDGACPYYDTYECADGRFVAVGALEPQFFALLIKGLGLDIADFVTRDDPATWPAMKAQFGAIFRTRARDEWAAVFDGTDACVAPVLDLDEAPRHPHNAARATFLDVDGVTRPAASPRFSRTSAVQSKAATAADYAGILVEWSEQE